MRGRKGVKMKRSRSDSKGKKTEGLGPKVGRGEEKGDDQIRLPSHDAGFGCASRWSKTTHLLNCGSINMGFIGSGGYFSSVRVFIRS
jgi:hypothetical protein